MTRMSIVILVLAVLAALWAAKKLYALAMVWLGRRILTHLFEQKLCVTCFTEDRQKVNAEYEIGRAHV